ncbi:MAG: stage II sporulation protein M [Acidobacteriia bacterium]|nr:stage II sporulation protein M [Terriglobia bacterium]
MAGMSQIFARVRLAIRRTRRGVLWMGCAYALGLTVGMVSVHLGHQRSLAYRDRIVSKAQASSTILRYSDAHPVAAAALDFGSNLLGATLTAAAGWYAPAPFPLAIYRGWIGGIVSVDGHHRSRFRTMEGGLYYGLVVALQLVGYVLSGGAGVNLGLARTGTRPEYRGSRLLSVPTEAFRDAAWMFVLVIPIFALASALEFLWDV